MTQPKDPTFDFECPRTWDSLAPTADDAVRHCDDCDKPVHLSRNAAEAEAHGRAGRCIALDVPVPAPTPAAVPEAPVRRSVWTVLLAWLRAIVRGRAPLPLERIPDPPQPPPDPFMHRTVGMPYRPPDPPPAPFGWLVCVDGPTRGQLLEVRDAAVTIGSSDAADLRLDDATIAAVHCRLALESGEFVITDLSDGKTFMNDRAIARGELVDGDRIALGARAFVFKSI